jgi:hypothetical protein
MRQRKKVLRKGPKRQRKKTVSVKSYCRRGARAARAAREAMPF